MTFGVRESRTDSGYVATPGPNANGYYTTGALYASSYLIQVIDHPNDPAQRKCMNFVSRSLSQGGWRMDFDLAQPGFGQGMTACP